MNIETQIEQIASFKNLKLLANQIVEGFISGMHRSPFHGFSAEFSEHKIYNLGDNTKNIDWKLYAKTDRLYTKRFEEETNLRCHIIIDNSSSMHYPKLNNEINFYKNKIGFSVMATAVLMNLLKKQRDAIGLSVFSNTYEYYAPEKGSDRHHRMIINALEKLLEKPKIPKSTNTIHFLHQIAEKLHRRSIIILFTDMLQNEKEEDLFAALQHLKYNKHKVILFHVVDKETEFNFDFDNAPRKFIDIETGEEVTLFADNIKQEYEKQINIYFKKIKTLCNQNKIKYISVNVKDNFEKILTTYLVEKQNFE